MILLHVNVSDFAGLGIASEKSRNPGIGFHDPQQDIGGGRRRQVKLFGNDRERWGRFEFLLIIGHKKRNTKESIIKFVKGLAFVRLGKDPVIKVSNHQGLAGLEVRADVIEHARLRVGRGPRGGASHEQRGEQEGTAKSSSHGESLFPAARVSSAWLKICEWNSREKCRYWSK